jgi:hypothetical protein
VPNNDQPPFTNHYDHSDDFALDIERPAFFARLVGKLLYAGLTNRSWPLGPPKKRRRGPGRYPPDTRLAHCRTCLRFAPHGKFNDEYGASYYPITNHGCGIGKNANDDLADELGII